MARQAILDGKTSLGIEFGSTRIKAVLIGIDHKPIASGAHDWENRYQNGVWTYPLEAVWAGVQDCYTKLAAEVQEKYGVPITKVGSLGISAMMHGYLAFDKEGRQLAEFRTWRNTTTDQAAQQLTGLLHFNIPQRWSIAHLWQAVLNGEEQVKRVDYLTTLAGYVHWKLTGERVLGVGDASGMFPIDVAQLDYHAAMMEELNAQLAQKGIAYQLRDILPKILKAGDNAGILTRQGALLLDPKGNLQPGTPLCPPEGDAGTGMVATNSIAPRTGNVSAGTSIFAMLVLEKELSQVYTEIDMVATPAGSPVAMVHCNTCTSDLDAWVRLFIQLQTALGHPVDKAAMYDLLYNQALLGDADGGGLLAYNYYSGEPITSTDAGRPLFVRMPDSSFTLANFMRVQLYSTMATLKLGMDILFEKEQVKLDCLLGHGGLFKTPVVGQQLMAGALGVPVAVMETAGEGGPWGMAVLAAYSKNKQHGESLEQYLKYRVFADAKGSSIAPRQEDIQGFSKFIETYKKGIEIEKSAIRNMRQETN